MFQQVKVLTEDRNLLQFLWWEDDLLENDLQSYRMWVVIFRIVSTTSCANFALKQTAMDYKKELSPIAIQTVCN